MRSKALLPDKKSHAGPRVIWEYIRTMRIGYSILLLLLVFIGLSFLASFDFTPTKRLYSVDEVAERNITSDRAFLFENTEATRKTKEEIRATHPLVCDLNLEISENIRARVQDLFISINHLDDNLTEIGQIPAEMEKLRLELSDELSEDFPMASFSTLADPEVQNLINTKVMPWLDMRLREGVVSDTRVLLAYKGGILVRNLHTGEEKRTNGYTVTSLKDLSADLSLMVRGIDTSPQVKKGINILFNGLSIPTLIPNYDATTQRTEEAVRSVAPVVKQIQQGEIVVRQGEKITSTQQLELQALWKRNAERFNYTQFIGVLLTACLLSTGMFFSPSGKRGSRIKPKDIVFTASVVAVFSLMAKGIYLIGYAFSVYNPNIAVQSFAYAVPVAGAAGLGALIISTRRYFVTGLLLAFFCTIMMRGSLNIFLFYFLSSMLSTWLIAGSQSRQDAVWSLFPLILGLFALWAGSTFMYGGPHNRYFFEACTVLAGGLLSLFFTFALAPVVELFFRYTTRFLLMELMNLEQPLMRKLMLDAPGTYHHSLIVSNMVEAAAKAISAHSLLCKVGALYHDIGKIEKPIYFIENQFNHDNPHDRLTPNLSALVLISHAKRGVELAEQFHLGEEVTSIIAQHHGTSSIKYFYQKALKDNPVARIGDFSYPGPRPQTREAVLVMLADAVEASSRTLDDPTPSRIKNHIHKIIRNVLVEGQLEEADLTFRDLDKVAEAFNIILNGIFHHRIEYPDKIPQKPIMDSTKDQTEQENENISPAAQWLPDATNASPGKGPDQRDKASCCLKNTQKQV